MHNKEYYQIPTLILLGLDLYLVHLRPVGRSRREYRRGKICSVQISKCDCKAIQILDKYNGNMHQKLLIGKEATFQICY